MRAPLTLLVLMLVHEYSSKSIGKCSEAKDEWACGMRAESQFNKQVAEMGKGYACTWTGFIKSCKPSNKLVEVSVKVDPSTLTHYVHFCDEVKDKTACSTAFIQYANDKSRACIWLDGKCSQETEVFPSNQLTKVVFPPKPKDKTYTQSCSRVLKGTEGVACTDRLRLLWETKDGKKVCRGCKPQSGMQPCGETLTGEPTYCE
jgi:hypothetical protein